jgi:glyceraldehyde-3-phosphate dehydrogenase (NADP+)
MNLIPEEFQIKTLLNQDTYLVDGNLKKWEGKGCILNDLIQNMRQRYWASHSIYGEAEGKEAVNAAHGLQ